VLLCAVSRVRPPFVDARETFNELILQRGQVPVGLTESLLRELEAFSNSIVPADVTRALGAEGPWNYAWAIRRARELATDPHSGISITS
jgi:hypothetical protein